MACFLALWHLSIPGTAHCEQSGDENLAVVDKTPVTVERFVREAGQRGGHDLDSEARLELLESIVRDELAYHAAARRGFLDDPEVRQAIRRMVGDMYRQKVLAPRLDAISVSDGEIREYYEKHAQDMVRPSRVRGAVIRISVPEGASEARKAELLERARQAREQALEPAPGTPGFGSVAVRYSDHQQTRYRGGDTGWLVSGRRDRRWPQKIRDAIFAMEENGVPSEVIRTPGAAWIVMRTEAMESEQLPLAMVDERIRHRLIMEKRQAAIEAFYRELEQTIEVKVHPERLDNVELPDTGTKGAAAKPPSLPR